MYERATGTFSLSNLWGTTGGLLLLFVLLVVAQVGLALTFKGHIQL